MNDALREILEADPRLDYALLFGSVARGDARPDSDLDVAIGVRESLTVRELGDLISRVESACGREVDLVVLNEAPPAVAYRVFQEGEPIFVRDRPAFVERKARAILVYLDWKPFEDILTRGALAAAKRDR